MWEEEKNFKVGVAPGGSKFIQSLMKSERNVLVKKNTNLYLDKHNAWTWHVSVIPFDHHQMENTNT